MSTPESLQSPPEGSPIVSPFDTLTYTDRKKLSFTTPNKMIGDLGVVHLSGDKDSFWWTDEEGFAVSKTGIITGKASELEEAGYFAAGFSIKGARSPLLVTTRLHGTDFSWSTLADPLEDNQAEGYLNKYNLGAFSWVLNGEERERTLFIPDDVNTLHLLRFSYAPEPQKE